MSDIDEMVERLGARLVAHLIEPPTADEPVMRHAEPDEIRDDFSRSVGLGIRDDEPAHPTALLVAATDSVMRWSVQTGHPRFVNQNFAGADPVAVVGDWMGAALNTTAATYEVAPVFTLMERAVIDKLATLAGFPPAGADEDPLPGLFAPGGSTATLYALQLARHRRNPDLVRAGDRAEHAVFVSEAGHYSVGKAAALLGMGSDAVVTVETDDTGSMRPDALTAAIDSVEGRRPLAVVATAGTTVTGAFDPIDRLADICTANDLWLHVDGAYGASALFSPHQRRRMDGVDRADSLVWDLHKMMGMTQQCSALLVRDAGQLDRCFATGADYLFQPDKRHRALDTGDRTFQCGRRVDVVKLWMAWKTHGDAGFASRIDDAVAVADHVRSRVAAGDGRFVPVVAGDFTNVCIVWLPPELRATPLDALDRTDRDRVHALAPRVKARMQDEGTALVGFQPVHGLNCFRLIFMNPRVSTDDADTLLALIDGYATEEWDS